MSYTEQLEELKQQIVSLRKAYQQDMKGKDEAIQDLKRKQDAFEVSRKAPFSGVEEDTNEIFASGGNDVLTKLLTAKTKNEEIAEFQKANDEILLVSQLTGTPPAHTKLYREKMREIPFLRKTESLNASGSAGYGSDWVPTGYSARLFDRMRLEMRVPALFEVINQPTAVYVLPIVSADSQAYLLTENATQGDFVTAANLIKATQPTTGKCTLTAKKLGARVEFSEELNEDSVTPILPLIERNIIAAQVAAEENAIINGDDAVTHMDYDVTAATDCRKAWDGLRYHTQSAAKVSLNTLDGDHISQVRGKMGKYGILPSQCAWIVGINTYNQLMLLTDNSTNKNLLLTTLDKYGQGATILTGELGRLFGIPVIVSEYIRENLNGSAIYDGSMVNRSIMLLVNRTQFIRGDRRSLKIETARQIQTDQTLLVSTTRKSFAPIPDTTSEYIIGMGYNIVCA
jgi:HK97 family phage major capsid protein